VSLNRFYFTIGFRNAIKCIIFSRESFEWRDRRGWGEKGGKEKGRFRGEMWHLDNSKK
jgi:hypothetical protein